MCRIQYLALPPIQGIDSQFDILKDSLVMTMDDAKFSELCETVRFKFGITKITQMITGCNHPI
jgi:hypothetical protein